MRRACHAADRTGHMILQTLYQQCIKNNVTFFDEYHVVDLICSGEAAAGVVAVNIDTGELHVFHSKAVVFATGGWGKVGRSPATPTALTGDGTAICFRRGVPLQDMEFFQFHPTGIYPTGHPDHRGRARRGRHAAQWSRASASWNATRPRSKTWPAVTWSRARSISNCEAGRGIKGKHYVHLDVTPGNGQPLPGRSGRNAPHRRRTTSRPSWPDIVDFCRTYAGRRPGQRADADPADRALCAWAAFRPIWMARVISTRSDTRAARPVRGGRMCLRERARREPPRHQQPDRPDRVWAAAGKHMAEYCQGADLPAAARRRRPARSRRNWNASARRTARRKPVRAAPEMQEIMMKHVGVFRTAKRACSKRSIRCAT